MSHRTDGSIVIDSGKSDSDSAGVKSDDLLSDPHCRYLLAYLRTHETPASLSDVARYVVGQITETPQDEVTEDVQRRVQTWLHHGQLPALDDHGIVDFDPDSGTVSLARDPQA